MIVSNLGTWKLLILSPRIPINAGRSVVAARTATKTTNIAPTPNAWKVFSGIINIPTRAKTTVIPLYITALPADVPELTIASRFSNHFCLSSLYLESMNKQ